MALWLALLLASAAGASTPAELFDSHGCRSCHRLGPRGGDAGPDLTLVGLRRPRAWLERWLESPRAVKPDTRMPEQGLAAADRAALAGFLSEQLGQAWGGERPWSGASGAEAGRLIYVRAGCVACHGPAGRGGHPNRGARADVIPALAPLLATYTPDELEARVRAGKQADAAPGRTPEVAMPAWKGTLDDGELRALSAYLLALAPRDAAEGF